MFAGWGGGLGLGVGDFFTRSKYRPYINADAAQN